jgi:hypothetical protein
VFSGMLGVTLFGIFLTPVFFYVIEYFVEAPLFTSARSRQVGQALQLLLAILLLGLPWLLGLILGRRRPEVLLPSPALGEGGTEPRPPGSGNGPGVREVGNGDLVGLEDSTHPTTTSNGQQTAEPAQDHQTRE